MVLSKVLAYTLASLIPMHMCDEARLSDPCNTCRIACIPQWPWPEVWQPPFHGRPLCEISEASTPDTVVVPQAVTMPHCGNMLRGVLFTKLVLQ